jgi:signal transduction histidine kinase
MATQSVGWGASFGDETPAHTYTRAHFSSVVQFMSRVMGQGRLALDRFRASEEAPQTLAMAFARVPEELGFPSTVRFRVIVVGRQRELRPFLCDELYRIGRQAIVNAYRHSQAREIETQIDYRPTGIRLAVRDNGRGIDPRELQCEPNRWGLQGILERAERLGARLRVWSRIALGTEVELYVAANVAFEQNA